MPFPHIGKCSATINCEILLLREIENDFDALIKLLQYLSIKSVYYQYILKLLCENKNFLTFKSFHRFIFCGMH